ncbi:MAG TPA: BMP family ABC transporter substrate-binding protein [Streptosporangiaceae bacterium]|jgi:basic membrane protein A
MRITAAVLASAMLTLGAAACGGSDDNTTSGGGGGTASKAALKVGMAYDIGGRGDQSFNDAAARGLDQAKSEFGVQAKELEATAGETDAQKEERLRLLAEQGYNPVIAVGFAYSGPVGKIAKEFPDIKFAIIDDANAKAANIANLTFAEEQGSYLVGVAAALKSKKKNVGFIGGVNVPLIQKFQAGYEAGVKSVDPKIKIQSNYLTQPPDFTGFNDPAKGKTAAQGMFDNGADIVYAAAGGSGGGVFDAAKAANSMAIGVDSDQALTAKPDVRGVIMTSMIKKVDVAVHSFIKNVQDNQFKAGQTVFDLKADGVGYATTGGKIDDIKSQLDTDKQKIISGQITVPTKP